MRAFLNCVRLGCHVAACPDFPGCFRARTYVLSAATSPVSVRLVSIIDGSNSADEGHGEPEVRRPCQRAIINVYSRDVTHLLAAARASELTRAESVSCIR